MIAPLSQSNSGHKVGSIALLLRVIDHRSSADWLSCKTENSSVGQGFSETEEKRTALIWVDSTLIPISSIDTSFLLLSPAIWRNMEEEKVDFIVSEAYCFKGAHVPGWEMRTHKL